MTSHELANILLQKEDVPVRFQYWHDELECHIEADVEDVQMYDETIYLSEDRFVSLDEEPRLKEAYDILKKEELSTNK